jgi:predicted transcriptional regulator
MKNRPTESELEVLALLWQHGPMTVRQVHDEITRERQVGYTTTLKIMQIMLEKGLLSRQKEGKTHIYSNTVDQQKTQNGLVAKMVSTVFQGSTKDLVMQALGNARPSQEELTEIRNFLDELNNKDQ